MYPPNNPTTDVILVGDTSSHPVLHFYQVSSNDVKGIQITERTRNQIQTQEGEIREDNLKSKKAIVVILERNTSSHPVLHFYQVKLK